MKTKIIQWFLLPLLFFVPKVYASTEEIARLNLTSEWTAWICLLFFVLAYFMVFGEGRLSLKKSKPMLVASGLIWIFVAISYNKAGETHTAEVLFREMLEFYVELFLFLLASTTYLNAMSERGVFVNIRHSVMSRGSSLKTVYWVCGSLTFIFSALLANFAVALVLASVLFIVGRDNLKFIVCGCVSLVVAANAGGCFSPFGDVTTLMIWQKDLVNLEEFPNLFLPSLVNWLVPAIILSFGFESRMSSYSGERTHMSKGAWIVSGLFIFTLFSSIIVKQVFHLPAVIGMMTGLGLLKFYGYYLKRRGVTHISTQSTPGQQVKFDIFRSLERSEWDTLMFLYGVMASISGLAALGYLDIVADTFYGQMGATNASIIVGLFSAFIDNSAVMYSVILMHPDMSHWHWLLITLTAGVGGSLLAMGSAAGIVIMGFSEGRYTFLSHLKWSWAIALGYIASIAMHYIVNGSPI